MNKAYNPIRPHGSSGSLFKRPEPGHWLMGLWIMILVPAKTGQEVR